MKRVLLPVLFVLAAAGLAAAAPPGVPEKLTVKPGQLVRVTVKGDAALGSLKNFTDEEAFWGELVSPKGSRQFVFQAPAAQFDKAGKPLPQRSTYVIGWWTKGEVTGTSTTITVEGATAAPTPVEPDPKEPDPKEPDPKEPVPTKFYFMVVRPDGPASPAFTTYMSDPAWNVLRGKGHLVKDFTAADAAPWVKVGSVPLPAVATLGFRADGKTTFVARPPVPAPAAGDDILRLPELK